MSKKRKKLTESKARWRAIERKYGLKEEDYKAIFSEQKGVCAICLRTPEQIRPYRWLSVDHDHETGSIRGLLCYSCNHRLLGYLIKDRLWMAKNLVKYLGKKKSYGKVPE